MKSALDDNDLPFLISKFDTVVGYNSSDGWETSRERKFYNVMCVGWEGDVAYRRGIGLVQKDAWDCLGTESVTFKLG